MDGSAVRAQQRAEPGDSRIFISSGQPEAVDDAASTEIGSNRCAEILRRLRSQKPKDAGEALSQIQDLTTGAADPEIRAALITAMRTEVSTHFNFSATRRAGYSALEKYANEPEVVQLCVEEFQTRPKDPLDSGLLALSILLKVHLESYPESNSFLFKLIAEQAKADPKAELPGTRYAIAAAKSAAPSSVEDDYVKNALAMYRDCDRNLLQTLPALTRLGSPGAVRTLRDLALDRVFLRQFNFDSLDTSSLTAISSAGGAVIGGLIIGAALAIAHDVFKVPFLVKMTDPQFFKVLLAGAALSGGATYTIMTGMLRMARDFLFEKPYFPEARQEALSQLIQLLPNEEIERDLLEAIKTDRCDPDFIKRLGTALKRSRSSETMQGLSQLLEHRSETVRLAAIEALSAKCESDPSIHQALSKLAGDFNPAVRQAAIEALSLGSSAEAVPK
ncbi:MAG: HEAT repeat domain-containing protein [Oligoflexia bacterium]|nr:HEAT repeat domain-containing protein [Oligoflexia bacterium]